MCCPGLSFLSRLFVTIMVQQAAELGALKAEEQSSKSKLEQKLAARRQKKTEELRKKEERQLKEKAARDAKRLEVCETNESIWSQQADLQQNLFKH